MTNTDLLIKRAIATIIDDFIKLFISIIIVVFFWAVAYLLPIIRGVIALFWLLLMLLLLLLIPFLYHISLEGSFGGGQTIGKRILKIKVTTLDGKIPSYTQTAIRTILRLIDMCFFYLVGLVAILLSEKDQRIGDVLAKTIVVEEKT
ncbi:MAG: RDD family protein [Candidatus Altiarchaeales archaeon]|nr:MAG: RDD family protein [Candidatus Altiarchaeales archaeon]RLI95619.1 MAG: RDD family protein [Candidatus Altiarchaeales archaeon]HDO82754.1 RDD family protein [Candidatus Altiarchaeales archaeon]HEX55403.1 RDD family protein [Candidatus Altiarchaeales archaeon]